MSLHLNSRHATLMDSGKSSDEAYRALVYAVPGRIPAGKWLGYYDAEDYPVWDDDEPGRSASPIEMADAEEVSK